MFAAIDQKREKLEFDVYGATFTELGGCGAWFCGGVRGFGESKSIVCGPE